MNDEFVKKIIALRGDIGRRWLNDLPEIIREYENKWEITCFEPFHLSYNYVAPAKMKNGTNAVLKITYPQSDQFPQEFEALRFYDGNAAIKVLKDDIKNGVMLLEKATPGKVLKKVPFDNEQIHFASDVLKALHKPISYELASVFPTIENVGRAFASYRKKFSLESGSVPKLMFEKAEDIFTEFPKDKKELVLAHGDLHNDNILLSERGWLVIDPKGIVAEREYDLGAYLRNPYYDYPKGSDYKRLETQRIFQFAEELDFDKERIHSWAFACSVISLLWFLEDENHVKEIYIQNAELIDSIVL